MNLIIAASSGGVTDILRETGETFGWNLEVVSVAGHQLLHRRVAFATLRLQTNSGSARGASRKIEEGQLNAEKIKKQLAEAEQRYREILAKANGRRKK